MINRILKILLRILSSMPFALHYALSRILYAFIFYIKKYRKQVVYTNLRNSFPSKNDQEINNIAQQFYKNFSEFVFENVKLLTLNEKQLRKRISLTPESHSMLAHWYSEKRNIIILSGHVFNWEYCSLFPKMVDHKVLITYQILRNKFWEDITKAAREKFGGIAIDYRKTYREIKKQESLGNLSLTWICGDQMPHVDSRIATHNQFLNQKTYFYNGINAIAKKTNSVVIFLDLRKNKDKSYIGDLKLITSTPKEHDDSFLMESYARFLEELIVKYPDSWLWSHRRWKEMPNENK